MDKGVGKEYNGGGKCRMQNAECKMNAKVFAACYAPYVGKNFTLYAVGADLPGGRS